jgi:hypothetical protein
VGLTTGCTHDSKRKEIDIHQRELTVEEDLTVEGLVEGRLN